MNRERVQTDGKTEEAEIVVETLDAAGFMAAIEHMTVEEGKGRCRENSHNVCLMDMGACDLAANGRCHEHTPYIASDRLKIVPMFPTDLYSSIPEDPDGP